jgi:cytochrome c oxidase assembly protein subunit 15
MEADQRHCPPLTQAAWDQEFAHYRQIDQYAAVHAGMTLSEFKGIFFWEYIHRVLGRIIGMAVALPWRGSGCAGGFRRGTSCGLSRCWR